MKLDIKLKKHQLANYSLIQITFTEEIEALRDKEFFDHTYYEGKIEALKQYFGQEDSLYLIAKEGEEFVGFCSIDRGWWEEDFFFIREILVDPKFRKSGVGKELMNRCIEHAKLKKAIGVVTETAFENAPM